MILNPTNQWMSSGLFKNTVTYKLFRLQIKFDINIYVGAGFDI